MAAIIVRSRHNISSGRFSFSAASLSLSLMHACLPLVTRIIQNTMQNDPQQLGAVAALSFF